MTLRQHRLAGWLTPLLVLGAPAGSGPAPPEITLHVMVADFENADGAAGVAVWNGAQGFSEEIEHALATTYTEITDGMAAVDFGPFPPGVYAVTVYHDKNDNQRFDKNWLGMHDKNDNQRFDKNWLGMPRESWGVSNNVRPRLRAPRFDEARLDLPAGAHTIEIQVR